MSRKKWAYGDNKLAIHAAPRSTDLAGDRRNGKVLCWITVGYGCELATELHSSPEQHAEQCATCLATPAPKSRTWDAAPLTLTIERRIHVAGTETRQQRAKSRELARSRAISDRIGKEQGTGREYGTGQLGAYPESTTFGTYDETIHVAGRSINAARALAATDGFLGAGEHRVSAEVFIEATKRVPGGPGVP